MLAIFRGTYVVFGAERAPEVHQLATADDVFFVQRYSRFAATGHEADAVRETFGTGFDSVLPAWCETTMRAAGVAYEGPQQELVRGLCAAIALGMPFEDFYRGRAGGNGDGGARDRLQPRPVKPQPGGIAVVPQP